MPRFEVRCHEWGDDSDYHWDYCNSREEAQKIVGVKYYSALKADVILKLNQMISDIEEDKYVDEENTTTSIRVFSASVNELRKIKSIIE